MKVKRACMLSHGASATFNHKITKLHNSSSMSNPLSLVYSSDAIGYLFARDVIETYAKELATSVMNRAETVCSTPRAFGNLQIKVEKKVGTGDAKDVICAAVKKLEADILVMRSHDHGFFKRALLGSASKLLL